MARSWSEQSRQTVRAVTRPEHNPLGGARNTPGRALKREPAPRGLGKFCEDVWRR